MSFDPGCDSSMNFLLLIKWLSCSSLTFKDQKTSRFLIEVTVCPTSYNVIFMSVISKACSLSRYSYHKGQS